MLAERDNNKILRDFYLFWRWEYVKRCDISNLYHQGFFADKSKRVSCAKDLFLGFSELTGGGSLTEILKSGIKYRTYSLDIFKFTIRESQVGMFFGMDSNEILSNTIDKTVKYVYPAVDFGYNAAMPFREVVEDFQILENTTDWELHMVTQEDITERIHNLGYLVLIDKNADIDTLLGEIKKIHLGEEFHQIDSHINNTLKGICLDSANDPRAIGLWMWDYLNEKYGPGKPPHGKIAEARREMAKRFELSKLCYSDLDPDVIAAKYRGTCKCINAHEVLPF